MFVDLLDQNYKLRLITKNVLSVFSTNDNVASDFLTTLSNAKFKVNNKDIVTSDKLISNINYNYNKYENIFNYITKQTDIDKNKVIEYISYFKINHILWLSFDQINQCELQLLNMVLQLASFKRIIITDYFDDNPYKYKVYSLLFKVGLEDRLIIIPFRNLNDATSNSTCQCYVKEPNNVRIQTKFSVEYLNYEFKSSVNYYNNIQLPHIYTNHELRLRPTKYKYNLYQLLLILLYNIRLMLYSFFNWRNKQCL